jgi:hypothetical protein
MMVHIGWRELNVGMWLARLQRQEHISAGRNRRSSWPWKWAVLLTDLWTRNGRGWKLFNSWDDVDNAFKSVGRAVRQEAWRNAQGDKRATLSCSEPKLGTRKGGNDR